MGRNAHHPATESGSRSRCFCRGTSRSTRHGGYTWAQIATLSSVTGLTDEGALVSAGNLVVV
jgi:hypothetical protein